MGQLNEQFSISYYQYDLYLGYQGTASDCYDNTLQCVYSPWLEVTAAQTKEWASYMLGRENTTYHLFSHNCADEAAAALEKIQPGVGHKLFREMITPQHNYLLTYPLAGWYGGYKYGLENEEKFLTTSLLSMAVPTGIGATTTALSWGISAMNELPRCNFPDTSYALKSGLYAATTTSLVAGIALPTLTHMPETATPLTLPLGLALYGWYKFIHRHVSFGSAQNANTTEIQNDTQEEQSANRAPSTLSSIGATLYGCYEYIRDSASSRQNYNKLDSESSDHSNEERKLPDIIENPLLTQEEGRAGTLNTPKTTIRNALVIEMPTVRQARQIGT